jgi:LmbE family N-acetylglucosaminyl deacetylase
MEPLTPKTVLAVAAHADDIDYFASGTIAQFAEQGAAVHYLILTDGSKGTDDSTVGSQALSETRRAEQRSALESLGGKNVEFLNYIDGELEVTQALKRDIVAVIRRVKPDVVITIDPSFLYSAEHRLINHPDHRAAGQATIDAVFPLACNSKAFPKQLIKLEPHKTKTLLLINFDGCNHYTDVSDVFDKKVAAIRCHHSQYDGHPETAENVRAMAQKVGQSCGCELAESFVRIDLS